MRLKGKVALITGGASGLGRAAAIRLAEEGAKVCVTDLDKIGGPKTAADVGEAGGEAVFVRSDVSTAQGAEACVAATVARFGALHILFNNAGISGLTPERPHISRLETMEVDDFDRVIAVNLRGVFLVAKYAARAMRLSGGGSIINTASIAGIVGMAGPAYSGSKGGVRLMTKTMALELAKDRIRVNAVAPGFIDTPMASGERIGADETAQKKMLRRYADQTPIGRHGEPNDIANAVLYLASDEASFVTGHTLVIDGGFTAQ